MKRILTLILFFMMNIQNGSCEKINVYEITKLEQLSPLFQKADKNTFVFFDVDYVLTQPNDPNFQMGSFLHYDEIVKRHVGALSPDEHDLFINKILSSCNHVLTDPKAAVLFASFKQKANIIGFVSTLVGNVGKTDDLAAEKIKCLASLGLTFSQSLRSPISFSQFPKNHGHHPLFKDGVLFTNGEKNAKEDVLIAYLKTKNRRIKKIMIIEDKRRNLDEMVERVQKEYPEIEIVAAVHSRLASSYPKTMPSERDFEAVIEKAVRSVKETPDAHEPLEPRRLRTFH